MFLNERVVEDGVCHSGGVWDSAVVLSEWGCTHLSATESKMRVLELGAGTGLLSIVLSKLLGSEVVATDLPDALPNLSRNVAQNNASVAVKALSWGEPIEEEFDLIFLADCVFGEFDLRSLLVTLRSSKKPGGAPVRLMFGYKPRLINVEQAFFRKLGGKVTNFPTPDAYKTTNVQVFQIEL